MCGVESSSGNHGGGDPPHGMNMEFMYKLFMHYMNGWKQGNSGKESRNNPRDSVSQVVPTFPPPLPRLPPFMQRMKSPCMNSMFISLLFASLTSPRPDEPKRVITINYCNHSSGSPCH